MDNYGKKLVSEVWEEKMGSIFKSELTEHHHMKTPK